MDNKASITSLISAFARAYHAQNAENPIFKDTKAKELMTDEEYKMIEGYILSGIDFFASEKKGSFKNNDEALMYLVNTQLAPTPLARASFCEEALKTAMLTGTEQYVILGAGLDTFAFREPEFLKKYKVFEADHPLTQEDKRKRIAEAKLEIPENLIFVPCDFTKDNLYEKLVGAGFDKDKKTFFSWLGVSYYLSREDIEAFLKNLASFAAYGSTLLFDYAESGLFLSDIKRVQNMIAMAKAGGEEMKSSFDFISMELMLAEYGFPVYEHLTSEDIQRKYFDCRKDFLSAFEHINYVLAVIKK